MAEYRIYKIQVVLSEGPDDLFPHERWLEEDEDVSNVPVFLLTGAPPVPPQRHHRTEDA